MIITITLIVLAVSISILGVFTLFTVRGRAKGRPVKLQRMEGLPVPRVSILIPSRNSDADLERVVESRFLLDYPNFEIVYAVDSMQSPVVDAIQKFQSRYPHVLCKVIETGHSLSENPKVYKLARMEEVARGDIYWILDSNIRVKPDTLNRLVNEYLHTGAKLVFCPIQGEGGKSLGGIIESAYFNHFLSGNVITAWKLFKIPVVVGKSILMEKKTLDRFGGFSYFKDYLAEDYVMGETFKQSGIPVSCNNTWVTSASGTATPGSFFTRMARWAKLRFRLKLHFYILELLLNPIALAAIATLTLWQTNSRIGFLLLAAAMGAKVIMEMITYLFLDREGSRSARVFLLLPLAIVLKDILLFAVYFTPFFSSQVEWRGGKINIGRRTLIAFSQETLLFDGA